MNIAIDMMGGDFAPSEALKGLQLYLSKTSGTQVFCIGDRQILQPLFTKHQLDTNTRVKIIHAAETIGYHEHPTKALKEKPQSSIAIGFHLLSTSKADAFISAGNTGAMLVATMYTIKP